MNVGFVITEAWPIMGGLQKLPVRLGGEMIRQSHTARIFARFGDHKPSFRDYFRKVPPRKQWEVDGVPSETLHVGSGRRALLAPVMQCMGRQGTRALGVWLYQQCFGHALRDAAKEVDVLHYFGSGVEATGFAALYAARSRGIPFVVQPAIHAGQWGERPTDVALYNKADTVVAHTEVERKRLVEIGVKVPTRTVMLGVDESTGGDGAAFRSAHNVRGPMVLFLGRKTREKGVELVVRAFEKIVRMVPDCILVVAGPGQLPPEFSIPGVLDLASLSDAEKHRALAACDALCVPSEGESFGMVYFEAWHYRKPVIGLRLTTLEETIGQCGGALLVERSPEAVADALQVLLSNPSLRRRMGEAGKRQAVRHSWLDAAQSCMEIYRVVMQAGAEGEA